jgi:Xaa-Pro aminopeptidase
MSSDTQRAAHDPANPEALLKFMTQRWARPRRQRGQVKAARAHRARRGALSQAFPGDVLIIPTGHEKVRANDTNFRFRPGTDFFYLTGSHEPDSVLMLLPEGDGHRHVLFVEPNPGKSNATFFTDRVKGELWVGARRGVPESQAWFGVDEARSLADLADFLTHLSAPFRVLRGLSARVDGPLPAQVDRDDAFAQVLGELRLIKDAAEVAELSAAIASTRRGFEDVITRLAVARSEREIEGVFGLRARVEGNDVGYSTIAACGAHACILHWSRNNGKVNPEDLLLLDAGVEGNSLYTADITRTLPISGTYSPEQREVVQLVHRAQRAGIAEVRPGNDFLAPNRAAMRVLALGLQHMGILADAEEALREDRQLYRRYTLHNVSHMLGLDVHDCARAREEAYKFGKLRAGMVLTVEPGLYFQPDDLTVPAKYRGIGVRIEDDILVTETGSRNLSRSLPSDPAAVERWMRRVWQDAAGR